MKFSSSLFALPLFFVLGISTASSATITWDGEGGDFNWNTALNWSGDAVPDGNSDVVITNLGTNITISLDSSVTVKSLQCSASVNVSGGNLTLTNGVSLVIGNFTMSSGRLLTVQGSNTTFIASGPTAIDGGWLTVSGGAVVSLPALQNYNTLCDQPQRAWVVTDLGSVLNLPGLTNITASDCGFGLSLSALAGGQLLATNLVDLIGGWTVPVQADGAGSLIDLRSLLAVPTAYLTTFSATAGGTNWVPQLIGGPHVRVLLDANSTLPVAQMQRLDGITASGRTVSFPALTNFDGGWLTVSGGAVVSLPALQNYNTLCDQPQRAWVVTDLGSVLNLPGLTNITASDCGFGLSLSALAGGQLLATNLVDLIGGWTVPVQADGAGSLIDLRSLLTATGNGTGSGMMSFRAKNSGIVKIPLCGLLADVSCIADSAGLIDMSLIQGISGRSCAITSTGAGSVIDLSSLSGFATPLGASSLTATSGGVILLNTNVFLFVNVAVNIPGNPVLPPVVSPGAAVSLYGKAWRSYWVDWRDTRFADSPWQLYRRVPQTNNVQVISGAPSSWQTFRVYEFVTDPSLLDLNQIGGGLLQPVLYGMTNKTFVIQSHTNLNSPSDWQPVISIAMTNSFRVLPTAAPTNESFFLRALEQ